MPLVFDPGRKIERTGVWRTLAPGVRVKIRTLSKTLYRQLKDQATGGDFQTVNGRLVPVQKTDVILLEKLMLRHTIEDWDGIVDPEGRALACTDEMKDLVCDQLSKFSQWVFEQADAIETAITLQTEDQIKNFSGSHDSSGSSRGGSEAAPPAKSSGS